MKTGYPDKASIQDVRKQAVRPKNGPQKGFDKWNGGARRDRTDDLLLAKQALSQLSYGPG